MYNHIFKLTSGREILTGKIKIGKGFYKGGYSWNGFYKGGYGDARELIGSVVYRLPSQNYVFTNFRCG
jgi:hypothetical protein